MDDIIFFGHWRQMLRIAREQAAVKAYRDSDKLSHLSASIILSRTCLEIYFNELYFHQIRDGVITVKQSFFSHRSRKRVRLKYSEYVNLHICERLEVSFPRASKHLISNVSLQNQIRNYCMHYTASDTKKQLELEFKSHPRFGGASATTPITPQEKYVNTDTAHWCNDTSIETIIAVEEGQARPNADTEMNLQHCHDLLMEK